MQDSVRALNATAEIYKRSKRTQMKDRFPTAEANTAVVKLREMSLLSSYDNGNFICHFTNIHACTGRDLQERISFVRERLVSEVRGRETLLEHLRTPRMRAYCGENSLVSPWERN